MKKKFLALLLSFCMIFSMAPMAFATDGMEGSARTANALPEASNGVITLTEDVDLSATKGYTVQGNVTIDLDGHNLKVANTKSGRIVVPSGATLTLKDSKPSGNPGKVYTETKYTGAAGYTMIEAAGGTFILDGAAIDANLENPSSNGQFAVGVTNGGTVTVESGTIEAGWYAIAGNGTDQNAQSKINIKGGTLVSTSDYALYLPHNCVTTITDGIVTGKAGGIAQRSGTLNIQGGRIASEGTGDTGEWNDGTSGMGNAAVNVGDNAKGLYNNVKVDISGGDFTAAGNAVSVNVGTSTNQYTAEVSIIGGTFANDVSAYVPKNYICAKNGDTWKVSELNAENAVAEVNRVYYKTLSDAVTAATEQTADNVTVNLLKDAALDGLYTLKTTKSIVLNLGGNTITDGRLNLYQGNLTIENGNIKPDTTTQPINVYGAKETTGGDSALTIADNVKIDADYALCVFPEAGASNKYGYNVKVDVYGNLTGAQGGVFVSGNIGGNAGVNADMRKDPDRIPVINIHDGAVVSGADTDQGIALNGLAVVNIYDGAAVTGREAVGVKSGVLNVLGGTLTAVGAAMDPATANNNGTEQTGAAISITSTYSKYGPIDVNVDAGTIISQNGTALYLGHSAQGEPSASVPYGHTVTVDVKGGHFSGEKAAVYLAQPIDGDASYDTKTVSGGYFSADVSDFVKADFAALPGSYVIDGITYQYLVDEPLPADVEVVNGAPEVNVPSADELDITKEEKAALDAAVQDISCDGLTAQANEVAATPGAFPTGEEALSQFKEGLPAGADAASTDSVTTVVVPRLEVTVKAYQADGQTLTLDIKAVYDIKATTDAKNMKEEGDVENKDVNTVTLKKNAGILDTTGSAVVISVPLPTDFVNDTTVPVYVTHSKDGKDSGDRYVYRAALSEAGGVYTATFTNVHGFSIFDFALETGASITDENGETTYYATLQEAVDAVQNGQTIVLLKDKQNATVTRTVTFTVQSEAGKGYTETITAGAGTTGGKGEDGRYSFTYTRPSSDNKPAAPTYAITTVPSVNGTISVSPAGKAKEDQTVTITVQPDNGYVLDEITVTDQNGNAIEVRLSETKYVFTMPKGEVTVKAAFKESAEVSGLPFTDVAVNSWYYDAIEYVYENGMMNGTEATLFSPNAATTRGMIVTILYRVEKEPAASDSQFTDVAAEAYYADAIGWAAENNIVTGDGDGKFRPNDEISREEFSAILYRYAEMKGEDMSKLADLSGFVDADQIQAYAREAMAWANGAGLILGQPGNLLDPQGDATRAEVATILTRYFGSFGQLA